MGLDGRFIFLWIAFNALYGQAKYRVQGRGRAPEERDIERFLDLAIRLDRDARIVAELREVRAPIEELIGDPFLDDDCWKRWDAAGVRDVDQRREMAIRRDDPRPTLHQVFSRLYVLRKQVFHGCATAEGSRNRQALKRAVGVLERLLPAIEKVVQNNGGSHHLLAEAPYPPSSRESVWNPVKVRPVSSRR